VVVKGGGDPVQVVKHFLPVQVKPHPGTRVQFLFVSDSRVQRVSQGVC
jgi:hypothetical protein